jgi:RimJ/RimL family protein N-acetyltransferase
MTFAMRETLAEDAAFIRRLFCLPHVRAFLNTPSRQIIVATLEDPNAESYVIEDAGDPVGNFVMSTRGFLVDLQTLAVTKQRCGAGTFALRWGLRRAFDELQAHRVFLEVREDNVGTRRLCERLGFSQEGVYRDGFRDERTGEFRNLVPYGMLERDYGP